MGTVGQVTFRVYIYKHILISGTFSRAAEPTNALVAMYATFYQIYNVNLNIMNISIL